MTEQLDVLRDQARYIDVDPYAVSATALRFGYPAARDLLALMATEGRMGFAELEAACARFVATGDLRASADVVAAYDARAVGALAQIPLGSLYGPPDYRLSAALHRFAHALGPVDDQPTGFMRLVVQSNLAAGEHDWLDSLLAQQPELVNEQLRWLIRTDRLGPAATGATFDPDGWSRSFSELLVPESVAPVSLAGEAGEGSLFERLTVLDPPAPMPGGPLVSVIMSVFSPDHSFETSVRSILAQSWTNLELLIVDDCSPPQFDHLLEAAASWDPRVTVTRMPRNGGTYAIRNDALARARGAIVTFQDSDDWSHPERLARQVAALTGNPDAVASLSTWARVTPDLTVNRVGYAPTRVNASSMMFWREPVLERLGGFDPVRKDADSEFRERLELVFGPEAVIVLPDVLAVAQLTADSLSRDDFTFGWRAATRDIYGSAFRYWHEQIAGGTADPRLDPAAPRPFPAPATFVTRQPDPVATDIAYISDWRAGINRYEGAVDRVEALLAAGLSVHVGQSINLRHAYRTPRDYVPEIRHLHAKEQVGWLVWTEPVHADLTLIDSAELLMHPRSTAGRFTTDRVVVAAGTGPRTSAGQVIFDPRTVEQNGLELFGLEVEWLPAHEGVADALRAAGARSPLLPARGIGVARPHPARDKPAERPAVVGTARIEKVGKNRLPGAQLIQALTTSREVRVLDDGVVAKLFRKNPVPANWSVVHDVPLRTFVADLDVYFGYAPTAWGAVATQPMLEALAAGRVLVVDPQHRPVFADAAVYAEPAGVEAALDALSGSDGGFAEQRERGVAFARAQLDPATFAELVAGLRDGR